MNRQYDIIYIQQYIEGRLSPQEMHELEHAALEDAMLQDAIDGYKGVGVNHKQLSLLQSRLQAKIETHTQQKNRFYFTGQRLAIASVAGVLFIVVAVLFWIISYQNNTHSRFGQQEVLVQVQDKAAVSLVAGSLAPKEGWRSFEDYISVNAASIATGEKVSVYMEIKESRPATITIKSATSQQAAQKVRELLVDGPLWEGTSGEVQIVF